MLTTQARVYGHGEATVLGRWDRSLLADQQLGERWTDPVTVTAESHALVFPAVS